MSDLKISEFTQATTIEPDDFIGGHRGSNNLKWALSLVRSHSVVINSIPVASGTDSFESSPLAVSGTKVTAAGAFDVSGLLRALNYLEVETVDNATGDFVTWSNSTKQIARRTAAQVRGDIGAEPALTKGTITATGAISLSNSTRQAIGGSVQISHSTTAGNRHIPSGGDFGDFIINDDASGVPKWHKVDEDVTDGYLLLWNRTTKKFVTLSTFYNGNQLVHSGNFATSQIDCGNIFAGNVTIHDTLISKQSEFVTRFAGITPPSGYHKYLFDGEISAIDLTLESLTGVENDIGVTGNDRRLLWIDNNTKKVGQTSGQGATDLRLNQLVTPDLRTNNNTDLIMRRNNIERLRLTSGGVDVTGAVSGLSSLRIGELALGASRTIQTQLTSAINTAEVITHSDGDHYASVSVRASQESGAINSATTSRIDMFAFGHNAASTLLGQSRAKSVFLRARAADGGVAVFGTDSNADVILARNNAERLRLTSNGTLNTGRLTQDGVVVLSEQTVNTGGGTVAFNPTKARYVIMGGGYIDMDPSNGVDGQMVHIVNPSQEVVLEFDWGATVTLFAGEACIVHKTAGDWYLNK